jgi:Relaxase/Mobilisation nuclease domain
MMPNVVRGDRMAGLLIYLAGPGRANEHTDPHLVAGDPAVMAWQEDQELGRDAALGVARHLDRPRTAHGVRVPGGHVWHCSLSLRAEEGRLSDERWRAVVEDFVGRMGFDDAEGAKAPTRWVAVRHGLSKNGNDHVHVVVNLVREDGTRASIHNDRPRAQKACREMEKTHGLVVLESADRGRSSRGWDPAEGQAKARRAARAAFEQAHRHGARLRSWEALTAADRAVLVRAEVGEDQPRHALARAVRGCATASRSEAEFVRRARRAGLLVRPRWAQGRTDVVTGYSVAERPADGARPIWYGGGRLGHDLTLPRLRQGWPEALTGAGGAAAEWEAARRRRRPVAAGRETREPDPRLWEQYGRDIAGLCEELRAVSVDDRDTWAQVARDTAGAFAAWSLRVEEVPGPLAATADVLAVSAQTTHRPVVARRAGTVSVSGAAMLLASVARGGRGTTGQAVMLRQLANLARAVHDVHRATGEARRASEIAAAERDHLRVVAARLPQVPGGPGRQAPGVAVLDPEVAEVRRRAGQGLGPPQVGGPPAPDDVEAAKPRRTTGPGADRSSPQR